MSKVYVQLLDICLSAQLDQAPLVSNTHLLSATRAQLASTGLIPCAQLKKTFGFTLQASPNTNHPTTLSLAKHLCYLLPMAPFPSREAWAKQNSSEASSRIPVVQVE